MPWGIERRGSSLQVSISRPVDDWEVLLEDVRRSLENEEGLTTLEVPDRIAGASRVDAEVLDLLRRVLARTSGIPVGTS